MILYAKVPLNVDKKWTEDGIKKEKRFNLSPTEPCELPDLIGSDLYSGRPDLYSFEPFVIEEIKVEYITEQPQEIVTEQPQEVVSDSTTEKIPKKKKK